MNNPSQALQGNKVVFKDAQMYEGMKKEMEHFVMTIFSTLDQEELENHERLAQSTG